jgi:peptidoglycan/LPS O-acetylase OafA/YrhL
MPSAEQLPSSRTWARLDGVDLLRGLAIFFVLMNHVNMRLRGARVPYTKGMPEQVVHSLVWNGQSGVQMFFAISGFLITAAVLKRWGSPASLSVRGFYLFRFARIAPLLFLLLGVLCTLHAAGVPTFVVGPKTGGLARAVVAALTFHINVLEAARGYLPPSWDILWSLSVEEVFYFAFPLICRLARPGKMLIAVLLAFVALGPLGRTVLAHDNPVWREYSYLGGMDAIALGCLTALFLWHRRLSKPALWTIGITGTTVVVFVLCFSIQAARWGLDRWGLSMSVLALGTCMFIAVFAQTRWRSPRLLAPLLILGKRSYEIYLTHIFVLTALFIPFLGAGKPMGWVPALFIAVIVVSGLVGETVARLYSEPLNALLRHRLAKKPNPVSSVHDSVAVEPANI